MAKEKNIKNKKPKKRFVILKGILIIILLIALAVASFVAYSTYKNGFGVVGMIETALGHDKDTLKNLSEFRVLILGVSTDISVALTDTIIVASYNPQTQKASLLSIPRDTFVGKNEDNANSYNKINALYQSGINKILDAVNDLTGLGIEYYMVVETEALVELVDRIGGVNFDVPINMDYDDTSQNLHIHLKAGQQLLNGKQAEGLVRFRHNNNGTSYPATYGDNDIGRMRTQREFLTQVAKQTIQLKNITKIGEIIDIAYKYMKTNISLSAIKDYIPYVIQFNTENIQTGTLPGTPAKINSLWFYKCNKAQAKQLVNELFNIEEVTEEEEAEIKKEKMKENAKTKIELINSSGVESTLAAVETALKKEGYTISKKSSTATTIKNTSIINNTKIDNKILEEIREILNVGVIQNNSNNTGTTNVTIIIGSNYNN